MEQDRQRIEAAVAAANIRQFLHSPANVAAVVAEFGMGVVNKLLDKADRLEQRAMRGAA